MKKLPFLTKIFISKIILFFTLRNQEEIILYFKIQKSIEILPGARSDSEKATKVVYVRRILTLAKRLAYPIT